MKKALTWGLMVLGIILIAYYLNDLGLHNLISAAAKMPLDLSLILLAPISLYFIHAVGWSYTMSRRNRTLSGIARLTLLQGFSYGIGGVIPFQAAFSEPMKLSFLRNNIYDREDLIISLVIDNSINGIAIAAWGIGGLFYLALFMTKSTGLRITLIAIVILAIGISYAVIAIQTKGLFQKLLRFIKKIGPLAKSAEKRMKGAAAFDERMSSFYTTRRLDFFKSLVCHLLEKIHGVVEFWLIFHGLNHPISWAKCFFIFSVTSTLDNLLFFMQLGGMEAWISSLLVAMSIHQHKINITAAFFRRIRLVFWAFVAIVFWLSTRRKTTQT